MGAGPRRAGPRDRDREPGTSLQDYVDTPDRCAAAGIGELWVYDPMLVGPRAHGGPFLLQLWRRTAAGAFERCYAGSGPIFSETLGAWLHPGQGQLPHQARLRISDDAEGREAWLTPEERVALLEAELRRRGG